MGFLGGGGGLLATYCIKKVWTSGNGGKWQKILPLKTRFFKKNIVNIPSRVYDVKYK